MAKWQWRLAVVRHRLPLVGALYASVGGVVAPPKLVALDRVSDEAGLRNGALHLAGQSLDISQLTAPRTRMAPEGASAYWLAEFHSLVWLPGALQSTQSFAAVHSSRGTANTANTASVASVAKGLVEQWSAQAAHWRSNWICHAPDVVGQRIVHASRALNLLNSDQDPQLYRLLRQRLLADFYLLTSGGAAGQLGWSQLSRLEGLCVAAASFDSLNASLDGIADEVSDCLDTQFVDQGAHVSADSVVSVHCLISLVNIRAGLERGSERARALMPRLTQVIETQIALVGELMYRDPGALASGALTSGAQRLAHFSGFPSLSARAVDRAIRASGLIGRGQLASARKAGWPWRKLSSNGLTLIAACPRPAAASVHRATHAGLAAIEVSSEYGPLFISPGMGSDLTRWGLAFRSTAAFCTTSVKGHDAAPIAPSGQISGQGVVDPLEDPSSASSLRVGRSGDSQLVEMSHSGFSSARGQASFYRRIRLDADTTALEGEERYELFENEDDQTPLWDREAQVLTLRFQCAVGTRVERISTTEMKLYQSLEGHVDRAWSLVMTGGEIMSEDGLVFDQNRQPVKAPNLSITARTRDNKALFFWRLSVDRPASAPLQPAEADPKTKTETDAETDAEAAPTFKLED